MPAHMASKVTSTSLSAFTGARSPMTYMRLLSPYQPSSTTGHVDVGDVAVPQPLVVARNAVIDDMVDRDAAALGIAAIAERRRDGAVVAHERGDQPVELAGRHAMAHVRRDVVQRLRGEPAGPPHRRERLGPVQGHAASWCLPCRGSAARASRGGSRFRDGRGDRSEASRVAPRAAAMSNRRGATSTGEAQHLGVEHEARPGIAHRAGPPGCSRCTARPSPAATRRSARRRAGVSTTCSSRRSGHRAGARPRTRPARRRRAASASSASTRAASSTRPPRAVLIRMAVGFISASRRASIRWRVSGESAAHAERRSRPGAAVRRARPGDSPAGPRCRPRRPGPRPAPPC